MFMTTLGLSMLFGQFVFTGFFLAIGFWLARKFTTRVDEWLFRRSSEFQEYVKEI